MAIYNIYMKIDLKTFLFALDLFFWFVSLFEMLLETAPEITEGHWVTCSSINVAFHTGGDSIISAYISYIIEW